MGYPIIKGAPSRDFKYPGNQYATRNRPGKSIPKYPASGSRVVLRRGNALLPCVKPSCNACLGHPSTRSFFEWQNKWRAHLSPALPAQTIHFKYLSEKFFFVDKGIIDARRRFVFFVAESKTTRSSWRHFGIRNKKVSSINIERGGLNADCDLGLYENTYEKKGTTVQDTEKRKKRGGGGSKQHTTSLELIQHWGQKRKKRNNAQDTTIKTLKLRTKTSVPPHLSAFKSCSCAARSLPALKGRAPRSGCPCDCRS